MSEAAVTGVTLPALFSTNRRPIALSERASMTCTSATAAHADKTEKSLGVAIVLYASGTANGATDDGVEQPPHKRIAKADKPEKPKQPERICIIAANTAQPDEKPSSSEFSKD